MQIVEGNIQQDNLSLSPNDLEQLVSRVSVVFHVAATVKFNEKLHSAVETNVKGTMRIMELCSKMNISVRNITIFSILLALEYSATIYW